MIQSEPVTTSTAPSFTSFQRGEPSSSSQFFPFFFAHASRLVPSNSTIAPPGGLAPRLGTGRLARCSEKALSSFLPVNFPFLISALQPSPLKLTVLSEDI